jgi:hypothetical protein
MGRYLAIFVCLLLFQVQALEYTQIFENDQICIAKAKIAPYEEVGLHRDVYPSVVVALNGGMITRLEADGRVVDVNFPTGVAVLREADPANEFHRSVNRSGDPIELMIVQLKNSPFVSKKEEPKSYDVMVDLKINCPMSGGLKEFVKSIPPADRRSVNLEEWKASFINSMSSLIRMIENEKIYQAYWSAKTDDCLLQDIEASKDN